MGARNVLLDLVLFNSKLKGANVFLFLGDLVREDVVPHWAEIEGSLFAIVLPELRISVHLGYVVYGFYC